MNQVEDVLRKDPDGHAVILPVHLMGYVNDMDAANDMARRYGRPLRGCRPGPRFPLQGAQSGIPFGSCRILLLHRPQHPGWRDEEPSSPATMGSAASSGGSRPTGGSAPAGSAGAARANALTGTRSSTRGLPTTSSASTSRRPSSRRPSPSPDRQGRCHRPCKAAKCANPQRETRTVLRHLPAAALFG